MKPEQAAIRQSLFREVNERIRETPIEQAIDAVCECIDQDCAEPISISVEEYERIRSTPTYFVVRPGHVDPEVERVVATAGDRFAVVEKVAEAAAAAARLDPRSRRPATTARS